jgi:hypothetical protein
MIFISYFCCHHHFISCIQHLACDTWIWADVVNRFARDVFDENQLSDADLRAALLGINIQEARE